MKTVEIILTGITRLGVDTAPIIYFVEAHPTYDALVTEIFQNIANKRVTAVTSVITLTEVLVHPIRKNNTHLQKWYHELLRHSENFELMAIDDYTAERAAELRAHYNLRTPDALQLAVALSAGCQAFLTNDIALKRVPDLDILVLDELLTVIGD